MINVVTYGLLVSSPIYCFVDICHLAEDVERIVDGRTEGKNALNASISYFSPSNQVISSFQRNTGLECQKELKI